MAAQIAPRSQALVRILLLEDSEIDTELAITHLSKAETPTSVTRVAKRDEFLSEPASGEYEVVLAEYSLPDFDGPAALDIVRERCPDLPLFLFSGVVGEEFAINARRRGRTAYALNH